MKKVIAKSIYFNIPTEKEDALYRAGFKGLEHNKTKNQKDTLIGRIMLLSKNGDFNASEWKLLGLEYHRDEPTACICGKTNLTNRYIVENIYNHAQISVGSSCLKKYFDLDLDKETLNAMKFAKGLGGKHSWLGAKYDAFVFSVLGFKKAINYFSNRAKRIQASNETNKLLRSALKVSLADFDSGVHHYRLERGKRLLQYLQKSHFKEQKEILHENSRYKPIYSRPQPQPQPQPQQTEPLSMPLYKKTDIQDIRMIEVLELVNSNLSKNDVKTINIMINYYDKHIKYRDEELSEEFKILHSGSNLDLATYRNQFYGIAKIQNRFCVFKSACDEVSFFGYVDIKENAHEAVDLYLEAEENIF